MAGEGGGGGRQGGGAFDGMNMTMTWHEPSNCSQLPVFPRLSLKRRISVYSLFTLMR